MEIENQDDLSSDHSLITRTLSNSILREEGSPKLTNKNISWDMFREIVDGNINLRIRLKSPMELKKSVNTFIKLLVRAANDQYSSMRT